MSSTIYLITKEICDKHLVSTDREVEMKDRISGNITLGIKVRE